MIKRLLQVGLVLVGFVSMPSWAILIDDAGVVGTIWTNNQNSSTSNEIDWANYLLGMVASDTDTADGNNPLDGFTEDYATSSTDYNGTIIDAFQDTSTSLTGWTSYEFVLGKYDGKDAGYILFNVADYLVASGSSLPGFSDPIWTNVAGNGYALSHWTGFNGTTVPEPGIVALLAIGLLGMVVTRRKMKV